MIPDRVLAVAALGPPVGGAAGPSGEGFGVLSSAVLSTGV